MTFAVKKTSRPGIFSGFVGGAAICVLALFAIILFELASHPRHEREAMAAKTVAMTKWRKWETWSHQHCVSKGYVETPARGKPRAAQVYGCDDGRDYLVDSFAPMAAKFCDADAAGACLEHGLPDVPAGWMAK
jgi:hypothetical protein